MDRDRLFAIVYARIRRKYPLWTHGRIVGATIFALRNNKHFYAKAK